MNRHLATSLFAFSAYSFTLLVSVPAASADAPPEVVSAPTAAGLALSPLTAALADGDDVRARFLFETTSSTRLSPATGAIAAPDVAALSPATAALADGDDIQTRFFLENDLRLRGLMLQP